MAAFGLWNDGKVYGAIACKASLFPTIPRHLVAFNFVYLAAIFSWI